MPTLFAWATPAAVPGAPVDHTWVTSYDNRVHAYPTAGAVAAAKQDCWFCWGAFHASGRTPASPTGSLGQQKGSPSLARCLVTSNADCGTIPAARGTIFVYGVDGVCHQLANQVLYATGTGSAAALTVRMARGYVASAFLYGTYGLQPSAWTARTAHCGSRVGGASQYPYAAGGASLQGTDDSPPGAGQGGAAMTTADEFEAVARSVLRDEPDLLGRLLSLRGESQQFVAQRWPGRTSPGAAALNARNQQLLDEAAQLLGAEKFERIFGFPMGEVIHLVDPAMAPSPIRREHSR